MNRFLLVFCCAGLPLFGCAAGDNLPKTVPARGLLTLDGKPLEGASITILPASATAQGATAISESNGTFSMKAFEQKDGALPGSYTVTVTKTNVIKGEGLNADGGENITYSFGVPRKYTTATTSGLTLEIPPEGSTTLKIELKSS